jgi:hypothetical protein
MKTVRRFLTKQEINRRYYYKHLDRVREMKRVSARKLRNENPELFKLKDKEKRLRYRKRRLVNYQVHEAIKRKRLFKPDICEKCGLNNLPIEAHHDDYNKPLKVKWLCRICHKGLHKDVKAMIRR